MNGTRDSQTTFNIAYWKYDLITGKVTQIKDIFDFQLKTNELLIASTIRENNNDYTILDTLKNLDLQLKNELIHLNIQKVSPSIKTIFSTADIHFAAPKIIPTNKLKLIICIISSSSVSVLKELNENAVDYNSVVKSITYHSKFAFKCTKRLESSNVIHYEY